MIEVHEGLGYNRATGEAIAIWHEQDADGNDTAVIRKVLPTGWFFEPVTQALPGNSTVVIAPWNFPTTYSIGKLINLLRPKVQVDGFEYDDANAIFPYSHRAARIILNFDGPRALLAAGQLIRGICARTTEDGRQEADPVIDAEIEELRRQVAAEQV